MVLVGRNLSERIILKVKTYENRAVLSSDIDNATITLALLYCFPYYRQYNSILTPFLKKYHPMFKN